VSVPAPQKTRSAKRYLWTIASIVLVAATALTAPLPYTSESATMILLGAALIGAGHGMRRLTSERISESDAGAAE
jgi:hypothetical protein